MNGPFQVAQLSNAAPVSGGKPPHIVKVQKPFGGQSVTVSLSYDGTVKADFSSIAKEKITLVHVGEKLIILFDNQSQITLEPFFDATTGKPLNNLLVELDAGRDVNATEFAALFPITDDQSVLPAAGGEGNAQASGANFQSVGVDPLATPNPLALLGPEDLASQLTVQEGGTTNFGVAPTAGFTLSGTTVTHDESPGIQALPANDMPGALPFTPPLGVGALIGWAQTPISEIATSTASFGTGGVGTITYALTTGGGAGFTGSDSGLKATATGNEIFLYTEGNLVVGREGNGGTANPAGAVAFVLYLDPATQQLDLAQYEAISHGNASDPNDTTGVDLTVVHITQTVTTLDGQVVTATSGAGLGIFFLDDGPSITVTVGEGGESEGGFPTLVLDETIGADRGNPIKNFPDGTVDDVPGNTTPDPTGQHPIGELSTNAGWSEGEFSKPGDLQLLFNVVKDPGTDGEKSTTYAYSFSLTSDGTELAIGSETGVGSSLKVTDPTHHYNDATIYLFKVSATEIVGYVGNDPTGDIALRITLVDANSLSGGKLVVDQYMAIAHGNPNSFDETASLTLFSFQGEGEEQTTVFGSLGITLTATITDRDNDTATSSATINIANGETSAIQFQDDGPTLSVSVHEFAQNSLFFDGFVTNNNQWGTNSGVATGNAGGWLIESSGPGGSGAVQLERVGDGYLGMHSPTGSVMVDLDASPHDVKVSQTVTGLGDGQTYTLSFEAGSPSPSSSHLEVWFGGQKIFDLAPTGTMTTYAIEVTGGSGDGSNLLEFRETGTPDFQGTYLANVRIANAIVVDETAGLDADSNDTLDPAVIALFSGVSHAGHDPDMAAPQYATGKSAAVDVTVDYGTDGPAAGDAAKVFSLTIVDGASSGLKTTAGQAIALFNEGGIIVGRYDSNGDQAVTAADDAAFAVAINPVTGVVSVVQYVSLQHPDTASHDEGIYLATGAIQATVTVTDGDGDHAAQSVDISGLVRFEDDGPSIDPTQNSSLRDWTLDEDVLPAAGFTKPQGNDALDTPADTNDYTKLVDKPLGVTWGADGAKALTFAATDAQHPTFTITDQNGTPLSGLTSGGVALVYDIHTNADGGQTLTAYKGSISAANQVFTLTLDPDAGTTGTFSFELTGALDHPKGDGQNTLVLNIGFTATDGDGDTASSSLTFRITDDVPYANGAAVNVKVDEDDIKTYWSQGTSPNDGPADGSTTEDSTGAAYVSGTLAGIVAPGADLPGTFGFSSDAVAQLTALGLFSKQSATGDGENGKLLTYAISNGPSGSNLVIITATEPNPQGNPVFSLTLNTVTGAYEFRLFDELIHMPGDGENHDLRSGQPVDGVQASIPYLNLGSIITYTDKDGDTVSLNGKFTVTITDDKPVADVDLGWGTVTIDESAGNQADDTTSSSVKNLFAALESVIVNGQKLVGDDPDVAGTGAIAYARSGFPVVVDNSTIGADSPPYPHQYALSVAGGAFSGLYITDGSAINLSVRDGLVIGTVSGGAFDGKVAFAIAIQSDGTVSVAQYLSIKHDDRGDSNETNDNGTNGNDALPDDVPNPVQQNLDGKITVTLTVKDSDGDTATSTVNIGKLITFLDDGPTVDVTQAGGDYCEDPVTLATIKLDETRGGSDGAFDDKAATPSFLLAPDASKAIGLVTTPNDNAGVSVAELFDINANGGADGTASLTTVYSLTLKDNGNTLSNGSSTGIKTTMVVTELDGSVIDNTSDAQRTIYLFKAADGSIVGKIGIGSSSVPDYVALHISIDASTGKITVEQYLPIQHGNTGSFDEATLLKLVDYGDSLGVTATSTITDGDGDTATDSATITLIDRSNSVISIEDDGPSLVANAHVDGFVYEDGIGNADAGRSGEVSPSGSAQTTGSLASLVNFGTDGPNTDKAFALKVVAPADSGLNSMGGDIYIVSDGNILRGYVNVGSGYGHTSGYESGDRVVFTLTVNANGSYTFTLLDQIDHPTLNGQLGDNRENTQEIDLSKYVVATDGDGDGLTLPTGVFTVVVQDDVPYVRDVNVSLTIDEGDLLTSLSTGTTPNDGSGDGSLTGNSGEATATGSLASLVSAGADAPLTYGFAANDVLQGYLTAQGITSKGVALSYEVVGNTLYGFVDGGTPNGHYSANSADRLVFTVTVNGSTGDYTFSLFDQVDHAAGNGKNSLAINLGGALVATDYDGDSVSLSTHVTVNVTDDVPALKQSPTVTLKVDEDDILTTLSTGTSPNDGNGDGSFTGQEGVNAAGPANATGSLAGLAASGADDALTYGFSTGAVAFMAAQGIKSHGATLSYEVVGQQLIGYVDAGGTGYQAGTDRLVFTLDVNASTGQFTFSLNDQLDHAAGQGQNNLAIDFGGALVATDYDKDSVVLTGKVVVNVTDDVPVASTSARLTAQVDEDDLSAGVNGDNSTGIPAEGNGPSDGVTDKTTFTATQLATLIDKVGADESATVTLVSSFTNGTPVLDTDGHAVKSQGAAVLFGTSNGAVIGYVDTNGTPGYQTGDRVVFKLTQAPNGDVTFDLQDQIDHPPASGDGAILNLNLSAALQITDYDGDVVPVGASAFVVGVENDIPANTSAIVTVGVAEDYLAAPTDGATGVPPGTAYTSDKVQITTTDLRTLVVPGADDPVIFSLNQNITGQLMTTDNWAVKSHGQEVLLAYVNGKVIGFANNGVDNDTYEVGDRVVFTLTPNGNGFEFDLVDKIDHNGRGSTGAGDAAKLTLDLASAIVATDFDGDTVNLGVDSIRVMVENDIPSVVLNAAAAPLTVDETDFVPNATAAAASFFTVNYGADGPAAASAFGNFVLHVKSSGVDSGLIATLSNQHVYLFEEGGGIVGRAGADSTSAQNGAVVFRLGLDSSSNLVLDQVLAVRHPDATNPDDTKGLSAADLITLTAKATDYDNDSVTATINIGDKLAFKDDGPTIDLTGVMLPKLTTDDTFVTADVNTTSHDTKSFAGLFTVHFGNDGAKDTDHNSVADADAVTYSLGLKGGTNVHSGVFDTATGQEVLLNVVGGVIVGSVANGNTIVFTIATDAAGNVTLTQDRAVRHDNPNDPDEASEPTLLNIIDGHGVTLTVSVTDGDGDVKTASADISASFAFKDDGPSVTGATNDVTYGVNLITNGGFETYTPTLSGQWGLYDHIPGWTTGGDGTPFELQNGNIAGIAPHGGSNVVELDGDFQGNLPNGQVAGNGQHTHTTIQQTVTTEVGTTYELDFFYSPRPDDGGSSSGMQVLWNGNVIATLDGATPGWQKIVLTVTGTGSDTLAFRGYGACEENEYGALIDDISLRSVSTRGSDDEDTALNGVGIQGGLGDDGKGVLTTGHITYDAGKDGLDRIEVTGLTGVSGQGGFTGPLKAVYVDANGNATQELLVASAWQADGQGGGTMTWSSTHLTNALVLAVNADGTYSLLQNAPLAHPSTDDPTTPALAERAYEDNLRLSFGFKVVDKDGDSATGTILVSVDDDIPTLGTVAGVTVGNGPSTVNGLFDFHSGADGVGTVAFDVSLLPSNLTSGGAALHYVQQGNVLVGYTTNASDPVFTITLNLSGGSYEYHQYKPLDGQTQSVNIGGETSFGAAPSTSGYILTAETTGIPIAIVSGWTGTGGSTIANVNGTHVGWGVNNANVDAGETLRFDFGSANDFDGPGGYTPPAFEGAPVSEVTFNFKAFNGGNISYVLHYTDGTTFSGTVLPNTQPNFYETWTAPTGKLFDYIEFTDNSGNGKIALEAASVINSTIDVNLNVGVTITDGDGDAVSGQIKVHVSDSAPTLSLPEIGSAGTVVDESALPTGTNPSATTEQVTGTFSFTPGDGPSVIKITDGAGQHVLAVGDIYTGSFGTLKILSISGGTVTYQYTLSGATPHGDPANTGTADEVLDQFGLVITDSDNDVALGSLKIAVTDDGPKAVSDGAIATVAEHAASVIVGNIFTTLLVNDKFGADGPGSPAVTIATGDHGGTIVINQTGDLLYSNPTQNVVNGQTVVETFTYSIKDADGDTTTATFQVTLTDTGVSGVSASKNLIADEDNLPAGNNDTVSPGDDVAVTSGQITYTLGADAIGDVSLSVASTGLTKLDGTAINTAWNPSTHTLTGYGSSPSDVVFTIVVSNIGNSSADYAMTLLQPVKHTVAGTEDNTAPFTVNVTVSDADGSTGTTSFTVAIDDDMPIATGDGVLASVAEHSVNYDLGLVSVILGNDKFGADGPNATPVTIATGDFGGTVTISNGHLYYSNTTTNVVQSTQITETFTYTIKDGDGDAATATFQVTLNDTGVTGLTASANLVADEDDLAAGNHDNAAGDDVAVTSGHLSYTVGADHVTSVVLSTPSLTGWTKLDGTAINASWNATTKTLVGYGTSLSDVVFTIAVTNVSDTGADYTMALLQPVKHGVAGTEDNTPAITVNVRVLDADGSAADTSFTVLIDDDIPFAINDGNVAQIADHPANVDLGTVSTLLLANDKIGADGLGGVTIATGDHGGTITISNGHLIYNNPTLNAPNSQTVVETFNYTVTDGDGDTSTASFKVTVGDTGVSAVLASKNLIADEDDLPAGNKDNATGDDTPVTTGHISYTLGSDHVGSVVLSTAGNATGLFKLDGTAINTVWDSANNQLIGYGGANQSDVVFRISVTNVLDTGADYAISLLQPVKHGTAGTEDNTTPFTVNVVVSDADGSTGNASFTVAIDDDMPVLNIVDTPSTVNEGQAINGTWTLAAGADGVPSVDVTVGNVTKTLSLANLANTVTFGSADGLTTGTLTVDADLEWHFTANQVSSDQTATFSIKATDRDGDTSTDSQTVTIKNVNQPLSIGGAVSGVVEEEQLSGGIDDFTSASSAPNNDTDIQGNLNKTTNVISGPFSSFITVTGAEGSLSYSFASNLEGTTVTKAGGSTLTSDGATVKFHVSGSTLTGYVDTGTAGFDNADRQVFTLELNQPAAGQFRFTLLDNLDHHTVANADNVENIIGINLNNVVKVTDLGDANDSALIPSFTVNVIDDIPVAVSNTASVNEGGNDTVNLVLIVDTSGSMDDDADGNGPGTASRLDIAKAALINLLNSANVNQVMVIDFASSADHLSPVWATKAQAIAYIQNMVAGGNTDYDAALAEVTGNWGSGPTAAGHTISYFLSDGDPNESNGTGTDGIVGNEITAWTNFLTSKGVEASYAVGVGTGVTQSSLNPIAYPDGSNNSEPYSIVITDSGQLANTLGGLLPGAVSGNLLTDGTADAWGADGKGNGGTGLKSITVDGKVYAYDATTNAITKDGAAFASGSTLDVNTTLGGHLTFYFKAVTGHAAGDYSYQSPADLVNNASEVFSYAIIDGDGDTSSATLTVNVTAVNDAPVNTVPGAQTVNEDTVLTFNGAKTISIADSDANGAVEKVTLHVDHGTLAVGAGATVTGSGGDLLLTGTISQINASLAGLTYKGVQDYNGSDTLTITTNDQGNTGSGGAKTDVDSITITINPVNDAPVGNADSLSATESQVASATSSSFPLIVGNVLTNDTDPDGDTLRVSAVGTPTVVETDAQLSISGITSVSAGFGEVARYEIVTNAGTVRVAITTGGDVEMWTTAGDPFQGLGVGEKATINLPYTVSDGNGGTANATASIVIDGTNDVPTITLPNNGNPTTFNIAENTTAVTTIVTSDPDGDSISYSLSGTDAAAFQITSGGVLTFKTAPDYEVPTDVGANRSYTVTVTANDGHGGTDTQTLTINVTNVNDNAPVFTSGATGSMAENSSTSTVVYDANATDADGNTITYSLTGTDASFFNINSSNGQVTFKASPDYDKPGDAGGNNVYDVVVHANDGTFDTTKAVAISVTNIDEAPTAPDTTLLSNISGNGASISVPDAVLALLGTDPEGQLVHFSSASNAFSGSVNDSGTTVTFTDGSSSSNGGGYDYVLRDPAGNGTTGTITVDRAQAGQSQLDGTSASEILVGRDGTADTLVGNGGDDILVGGTGPDTLYGGTGSDHFVFRSTADGSDIIKDFVSGTDEIDLLLSAFGGGSAGAIASGDLLQVASNQNAATIGAGSAHFLYQQSTGQLYYDSDGGSSANRVLLATLDNNAAVTANDIHKI
jgi:T1SS-143 domain-containing protein